MGALQFRPAGTAMAYVKIGRGLEDLAALAGTEVVDQAGVDAGFRPCGRDRLGAHGIDVLLGRHPAQVGFGRPAGLKGP